MKILVFGFYHKSNFGDDLFMDAFYKLFPEYTFEFTDHITTKQLENKDGIFFGGGSFLAETLKIDVDAFEKLKTHKIFYIGVGSETCLDPKHKELMSLAKVVAVRTNQNFEIIQKINHNSFVIPDLVYSLEWTQLSLQKKKSILIIPNILVVPKWNDPHWKHASWEYFKSEFVQSIDELIADNFKIDFLPLCTNSFSNDSFAAGELISRSQTMASKKLWEKPIDFVSAAKIISQYELVITQRFHGKILADIVGVSSIVIHHHDKLKVENAISYYGLTKNDLLRKIKGNFEPILPIDRNIFEGLKRKIENAICGR